MAFHNLCGTDPVLSFIRSTYNAVPVRLPDSRLQPLVLFTTIAGKATYLGLLRDLDSDVRWKEPALETSELGDVASVVSQKMKWSLAAELLGPFLAHALAMDTSSLSAELSASAAASSRVRITLERATRAFVAPLACARAISQAKLRLPPGVDPELGLADGKDLYLVDSVLSARELALVLEDDGSRAVAMKLEATLAGQLDAKSLVRNSAKLSITGRRAAPFAFTCVRAFTDAKRYLVKLRTTSGLPKRGLGGVGANERVVHTALGPAEGLFGFDE